MKRKVKLSIVAVFIITMLSGCCISHDWQEATCTNPKICTKCGETEGEVLGHSWIEATCTEPKNCSVCGITEGEALGHQLTEATYQLPAICKVCGETVGEAQKPYFVEKGILVKPEPEDCIVPVTIYNTDDISIQRTVDNKWTILSCYSEPAEMVGFKTVHLECKFEWITEADIDIMDYIYQFSIFDYYSGVDLIVESDKDENTYGNKIEYEGETYDLVFELENEGCTDETDWDSYDLIENVNYSASAQKYIITCDVPENYDGLVLGIIAVKEVNQEKIDLANSYIIPDNTEGSAYFRINPETKEE